MSENTLLFPQDYSLDSVSIVTSTGEPHEFRHIMMGLSYYEDIYNNSISGYILLNDAVGYLASLSFVGQEYLTLAFSKPGVDNSKVEKTFRIFKVGNRQMVNDTNESYYLHFCSEETVLSEQYKISKSYKSKKVSEIVSDIVLNQLRVLPEKFPAANLEDTKNVRDIIIPNLKPFEALNWLCTQAISANPKTSGSPYLFFENKNGYNFKSLQSLYTGEVYSEYKYEPKNLASPDDPRVIDLESARTNIISYEPVSVFDSIDMINSGAYANKLITIDPLRMHYNTNFFDYKKYFNSSIHLNDYDLLPNAENRFGHSANNTFDAVTKVVTTNFGEVSFNSYIKKQQPDIKENQIETTIPFRTAQIPHINANRYKIAIPGDPKMTVGSVIDINIPDLQLKDSGKELDRFYSGKYLVTAVKHTIDIENKFITFAEVSKESVPNRYVDPDNSLPAWKLIRGR